MEKIMMNQCEYIITQVFKEGYIDRNKLIYKMSKKGWHVDQGILELRCREINSNEKYSKILKNCKIKNVQTHKYNYIMQVEETKMGLKLGGGLR
jgi:predicted type IV restriction endonuclease